MTETVLVTGARGTVGNYVVGLAEAAGYRVIANDLTAAGVPVPVRGEVRIGDLRDASVLERVVRGVDHVVHTAAQLDATIAHLTRNTLQYTALVFPYQLQGHGTSVLPAYSAASPCGAPCVLRLSPRPPPATLLQRAHFGNTSVMASSPLAACISRFARTCSWYEVAASCGRACRWLLAILRA